MTSAGDWPFDPIRPFSAQILVADPPWNYKLRSARGEAKSPQAQYACMDLDAIKALPVDQLAQRHAWLFLWATAPMLPQALDVMGAWRFTFCTRMAWRKVYPSGKPRMGTGYVSRTLHEDVLIGKIGQPERCTPMPSLFTGVAREHSRKPDEFFSLVERFSPLAFRVELFARQSRPGWTSWGDQANKFDEQDILETA